MAQNSKDTSQYLLTPVKNWYLDLWVPRSVPKSEFDKIAIIPPEYDQRPDLMSYKEYGTAKLWWVFAVRNPDLLNDPIQDFVSGLEIYIPVNILKK
jgi:hypothetical protein